MTGYVRPLRIEPGMFPSERCVTIRTMPQFPAYHGTWQAWTMHCLKPIARHFNVDADDVLDPWSKHHGVWLALRQPETP